MPKLLFITTMLLISLTSFAPETAAAIVGVWQNGIGRGHIQIYKQNGKYYGKVIWLKIATDENGQPKLDKKNQNKELRSKPLIGMMMLRDFKYEDGEWTGGKIYNPEDGKEYKGIMKLKDSKTLSVRGYIGFSFIGKTDIWQKVR